MLYAVGLKLKDKSDHITIDGEDALIAALKVKAAQPEAMITYVRKQNKRGRQAPPGA